MRNLYRFFERDRVLIVRSEELLRRHDDVLRRVFTFLGVAEEIRIAPEIVARGERNGKAHRMVSWLLRLSYLPEFARMRSLSRSVSEDTSAMDSRGCRGRAFHR